jgi:predicted O-methyltransferase YrrM
VLDRLEERDSKDRQLGLPKAERVRAVSPGLAALLHALVLARGARLILELGTSAGYSTIWLASAAAAVGGRVVSIENDAAKSRWARGNLEEAGLAGHVELVLADAQDFCRSRREAWDLVLLDHRGGGYKDALAELAPRIAPGGVVVADGWRRVETWLEDPVYRDYLEYSESLPGFRTVLIPFDKGAVLSYRERSESLGGSGR